MEKGKSIERAIECKKMNVEKEVVKKGALTKRETRQKYWLILKSSEH